MSDFYLIEEGAEYPKTYCPDMEAVERRRKALAEEYPGKVFQVIPCDEWFKKREESYLAKPIEEVSADAWDWALNCLPPLGWTHDGGIERFDMSEMQFERVTYQYAQCGGRYFRKYVRHGDRSTYFTAEMLAPFLKESSK